jgi:hypothetical protein
MDKDTIWVVTNESEETRGGRGREVKPLKIEELAVNINLFLEQVGGILEKTPEKLGKFHFDELEVHAEITGKGTIALFGTGGELGAAGGLRFVFRRSQTFGDVQCSLYH